MVQQSQMGFILSTEDWFKFPNSMTADSFISKTHTAHQPRQEMSLTEFNNYP